MTVAQLDAWTSPNSVSIFAQPPGVPFVAYLLSQVPIPLPGRVRLDLAESEVASRRYTITRNPVERLTAQHVIREPDTVTITGMLCANPLLSPLTPAGLARLDRVTLLSLKTIVNRPDALCFIVTPERRYANMLCTSLVETYDESSGNGVNLQLTFEELLIATPGLVESVLDLDAMLLGAATTSDMGPTTPAEIPDPGGLG